MNKKSLIGWGIAISVFLIGFIICQYILYQKQIAVTLDENEEKIDVLQSEEALLRKDLEKAKSFIDNHLPLGELGEYTVSFSSDVEGDNAVTIASRLQQAFEIKDYNLFLSIFTNEANTPFFDSLNFSSSIEEREQAIYDLMNKYTHNGKLLSINARELKDLQAELVFEYENSQIKKVKVQLAHMYSDGVDDTLKIKTPHEDILKEIE